VFHQYAPSPVDLPPQLAGLYGLGVVPLVPVFLLAGGAAGGVTLSTMLGKDQWSIGEYNYWMRTLDDTFRAWDPLGWRTGCWQKHPERRRAWVSLWERFSKHYAEHPVITRISFPPWALESEEAPARAVMKELAEFQKWLNRTCGAKAVSPVTAPEVTERPPTTGAEIGAAIKWGAIGIAALLGLNVLSALRGAATRR